MQTHNILLISATPLTLGHVKVILDISPDRYFFVRNTYG